MQHDVRRNMIQVNVLNVGRCLELEDWPVVLDGSNCWLLSLILLDPSLKMLCVVVGGTVVHKLLSTERHFRLQLLQVACRWLLL